MRKSFNTEFDTYLPEARGNILIVTCVGDRVVLPGKYHDEYLPIAEKDIKARMKTKNQGIARRRLDDGTRVIMIYGRDNESIHRAVEVLCVEETE